MSNRKKYPTDVSDEEWTFVAPCLALTDLSEAPQGLVPLRNSGAVTRDGRYLGSYLLPRVADDIAWGNGGLYVVYNDPYPHRALLRPHGRRLP